MEIGFWGALGFMAVAAVVIAAFCWLVSRRILISTTRRKSKPISVFTSAWRAVFALGAAAPLFLAAAYGAKLFQSLGKDLQNITLGRHALLWSVTGMAIDLIFALAWAAVAMRIYFHIVAPETTRLEKARRTRTALIYALAFWAAGLALNGAGVGLVIWVKGADHGMVIQIIGYLSYAITIVATMCRPGIAKGLNNPLKEAIRILRPNLFGGVVTLFLAALPLGSVFVGVALITTFVRLKLYAALLLELPIAAASALCYLAFEAAVATMYRRLM